MKYRYYSTQRPIGPGTFPRQGGRETITNFFGGKIFCEEINREAWGFIEYPEPITEKDARNYELTAAGTSGKVLEGTDIAGKGWAFVIEETDEA